MEEKADLGVALDGDADRLLMVDHAGNLVDGDQLLFVVARDRKENGAEMDGVVGTLMSNFGLELALQAEGIEFVRAKVGDRYVMEQLDKRGWNIGGESSGHLVCLDCTTTGDGTVSALQVLAALSRRKQGLAESVADVSMLPQKMINVRGPNRDGFMENGDVQAAMADVEDRLAGNGRILLRPSGTEPLVRVMIEGKDVDRVESLCRELAEVVEKAIN